MIMTTFAVPREHQLRVLTFGILAVSCCRPCSSRSARRCWPLQLACSSSSGCLDRHRDSALSPPRPGPVIEDNVIVAFAAGSCRSRVLWTAAGRPRSGRRLFTPLFLVFLSIGTVDVLFASTDPLRSSASRRRPSSPSRRTPSRCSAYGHLYFLVLGSWTGWSTCPPGSRRSSCSSG